MCPRSFNAIFSEKTNSDVEFWAPVSRHHVKSGNILKKKKTKFLTPSNNYQDFRWFKLDINIFTALDSNSDVRPFWKQTQKFPSDKVCRSQIFSRNNSPLLLTILFIFYCDDEIDRWQQIRFSSMRKLFSFIDSDFFQFIVIQQIDDEGEKQFYLFEQNV